MTGQYPKPVDDRRAVKRHNEALAAHDEAWDHMHKLGQIRGRDDPDYLSARQAVVEAAERVRGASRDVRARRKWRVY